MKKTMMYLYNYIGFEESVEFKRFARALNKIFRGVFSSVGDDAAIDVVDVMGAAFANHILNLLFKFVFANTCDCDLSAYDKNYLAEVVAWPLDPDMLIDALVSSGFLIPKDGGGYLLNDWGEMIGRRMRERERDAERKRIEREQSNRNLSVGRPCDSSGLQRILSDSEGRACDSAGVRVKGEDMIREDKRGEEKKIEDSGSAARTNDDVKERPVVRKKKALECERILPDVIPDGLLFAFVSEMYDLMPNYVPNPNQEHRFLQDITVRYPELNLVRVFESARDYLMDNPDKAMKYKNLPQFLRNQVKMRQEQLEKHKAAEREAQMPLFVPDE